jgi:hypothetical protein
LCYRFLALPPNPIKPNKAGAKRNAAAEIGASVMGKLIDSSKNNNQYKDTSGQWLFCNTRVYRRLLG